MEVLKRFYLNASFYLGFILFSVFGIPALVLFVAVLSPFISHRSVMKRFRRAINWYGWVTARILPLPLIRIQYRDLADKSSNGGRIFICNHRSSADAFLIGCLPCELIQVVNLWPFKLPVLGPFARLAGYLSIREEPFEEFARKSVALLNEGVSLVAFPEGTRSGSRRMGCFHGTVFRVALQSRFPIVPLCISGTENNPPRGSLMLRPAVIRIHCLQELRWEDYKDLSPFRLKNKIRELMAQHLAVLEAES